MTPDGQRIENWICYGADGPSPVDYDVELENEPSALEVVFSNAVFLLHKRGANKVGFDITDGDRWVHVEITK